MKTTDPDERKKQGDQMMQAWQSGWTKGRQAPRQGHAAGKTSVSPKATWRSKERSHYYVVVEPVRNDEAASMVEDSPHLQIPDAYIEVVEVPHMNM